MQNAWTDYESLGPLGTCIFLTHPTEKLKTTQSFGSFVSPNRQFADVLQHFVSLQSCFILCWIFVYHLIVFFNLFIFLCLGFCFISHFAPLIINAPSPTFHCSLRSFMFCLSLLLSFFFVWFCVSDSVLSDHHLVLWHTRGAHLGPASKP